jgi:F-box/leucine-rich repeat protein 10/11
MSAVLQYLSCSQLCTSMLVCRTWAAYASQPALWKTVSLAHCKVAAAHLQSVVRRQPVSLVLDWSTTSTKQLGWLLPRLPQLQALSLQGCAWINCVSALRTCACPALSVLDLSFVSGLNDSYLREILSPPIDSRPGLADSRSRLRGLKELRLAGCDVSDVALRYIVQYLRGLEQLSVSSCYKVTDAGIAQLATPLAPTLSTLKSLDLSGCKLVTDQSLEHLSRLVAIVKLDCRQAPQISVTAVQRFCHSRPHLMVTCEKLVMSRN